MTLRDFPPLSFLSDEQVQKLDSLARHETIEAGTRFMTEGRRGKDLYLLLEGEVDVRVGGERAERTITHISAPAILGEMELLTGEPRSASVYASAPCRCALLEHSLLQEGIDEDNPAVLKFVHRIAQVLASRLADITQRLSELEAAAGPARAEELKAFKAKLFGEWSA